MASNPAEFTSLSRPLDPTYWTNRLIMVLVLIASTIAGLIMLVNSGDFVQSFVAGFWTGAAVFLSWAITREIDPDYEISALIAAVVTGVVMLLAGTPQLAILGLAGLMTGARVLNRVVGPPARPADSVVVLVLAAINLLTGHWPFAIAIGLIFLFDAVLSQPLQRHFLFAGAAFILTGVVWFINRAVPVLPGSEALLIVGGVGLSFVLVIMQTNRVTSSTDLPGYQLNAMRVRASMVVMLVAAVLMALAYGDTGVILMIPVWVLFAVIAGYRLLVVLTGYGR